MKQLKDFQGHVGREHSDTTNTYKGIPMFCDPFLHETCFRQLQSEPKSARILILGSGGGAFDQRLVDHGYTHVTSVDFRPDFFRANGTTFVEKDLNHDFSDLGTFDVIVAIELIEHLENPAHFFRNATSCLAADGKLIVTTPNIESGPSRASFLIQGKLSFFTEADMLGSGHITALPEHIFTFHANNSNLHVIAHTYNRNAWVARFSSNMKEFLSSLSGLRFLHALAITVKTIVLATLFPFTLLYGNNGNIHVYVLRKN